MKSLSTLLAFFTSYGFYYSASAFVLVKDRPAHPISRENHGGGKELTQAIIFLSAKEIFESIDDEDVSQHEFMANSTGYRPIEDWHEEHVNKDPRRVLIQLQQEKSRWNKKFESMGGEGI
jgi:hypothetical protein